MPMRELRKMQEAGEIKAYVHTKVRISPYGAFTYFHLRLVKPYGAIVTFI